MITIDKRKALAPKRVPTERLEQAALLGVACNTIMLGVCDDLRQTEIYTFEVKSLTKKLTAHLEKFTAKMYANISEEDEAQYNNLVRVVEDTCTLMSTMTPTEIGQFQALVVAFKAGEVYMPTTEKQLENMINQKRVKPIK